MRKTGTLLIQALPSSSFILFTQALTDRKHHYVLQTKQFREKLEDIGKLFLYYEHVFFRPDDKRFILLDDLTQNKVESIKQIYKPRAIIESSPGNFQVWLYLAIQDKELIKTQFIKHLAAKVGGDMQATSSTQLGRMPYTRNCKLKHLSPNGRYPSAKLIYPKYNTIIPPITDIDEQLIQEFNQFIPEVRQVDAPRLVKINVYYQVNPINQTNNIPLTISPENFYLQAYQEMLYRLSNVPKIDRSRLDYSIANTMYKRYSYNLNQITEALRLYSPKSKEMGFYYIKNIIQSIKVHSNQNDRLLEFNFI